MKIAIYGAAGMVGSRLVKEALDREHSVTALVRNTGKLGLAHERLFELKADARDADDVAVKVTGHDAVIGSISPRGDGGVEGYLQAVDAVMQGCRQAGVTRLLWVGGAGSLEVAPGQLLIDQPTFPQEYLPEARAGQEALHRFRAAQDLAWTFASPAIEIAPGERTGKFKLGGDQVLFDPQGRSRISAEDFAYACIYQLEKMGKIRQRFTAAYIT
jgi:putative NADH-flavin reductase